jgi:hypothetical protein
MVCIDITQAVNDITTGGDRIVGFARVKGLNGGSSGL